MADLPFNLSWAKGPTGEKVLTTNCLVCHGAKLGGSLIVGLGNPNLDFTQDESFFGLVPLSMDIFGMFFTPSENAEMARYRRALDTEGETTRPDTIGSNPAMADFGVFASHRDPMSLEWRAQADPNMDARNPQYSDVPAWWIVRRKQPPRMFYSGYGQGDHARIMMAASMMCVENAAEANRIDSYFGDVEAFVNSLGPPKFTDVAKRSIDTTRTGRGRDLFVNTCSGCHGDSQTNKPPLETVPASVVGTDPAYALNASTQGSGGTGTLKYFVDWWGKSWYGTVGGAGKVALESTPVYSPPPLDGVWATAPYFHNGSVPTLEAVLNPALRPAIFRRSFKPEEYDFTTKVGWPFTKVDKKDGDTTVYDATRPGYLNTGHTFAAGLTDAQRRDLLEYLKTL
jgi:mono/diheme cytochrome c family protein